MTYKIIDVTTTKSHPDNGNGIFVDFGDGNVQHLSQVPLGDGDALQECLARYEMAYNNGLAAVGPADVAKDVMALKGKTLDSAPILQKWAEQAALDAENERKRKEEQAILDAAAEAEEAVRLEEERVAAEAQAKLDAEQAEKDEIDRRARIEAAVILETERLVSEAHNA